MVIAIPPPGRLNRFAVFFRFILAIWANIVLTLVSYGAGTIVAFIAWLITLITGKLPSAAAPGVHRRAPLPDPLLLLPGHAHPDVPLEAVRRRARPGPAPVTGSAPPRRRRRRQTQPPAAARRRPRARRVGLAPRPRYGTTPAYGTTAGYGTAPGYGTHPGYGTPGSGYGPPAGYGSAQPASQPANWRLVLPRSAKNLLICSSSSD